MLTNKLIKETANEVFSFTTAVNVETIFSDREKSLPDLHQKLENAMNQANGLIIIISDIAGSGKTTLIDKLTGDPAISSRILGKVTPLTIREIGGCTYDEFKVIVEKFLSHGLKFVIVDDIDIKYSYYQNIIMVFNMIATFVKETGIPFVLLGDYLLKNEYLLDFFPNRFEKVNLEPLDEQKWKAAIQKRLQAYAHIEHDGNILTEDISEIFFAKTQYTICTFRSILSIFWKIASDILPYNNDPAIFSSEHVKQWILEKGKPIFLPGPSGEKQVVFYEWLTNFIKKEYSKGDGMPAMRPEEFLEICQPLKSKYTSPDILEKEILRPLAGAGLLMSFGIPSYDEKNNEFVRHPPPYLPSIESLLRAELLYNK